MAVIRDLLARLRVEIKGQAQLDGVSRALVGARAAAKTTQTALNTLRVPLVEGTPAAVIGLGQVEQAALAAKTALNTLRIPVVVAPVQLNTSAIRQEVLAIRKSIGDAKLELQQAKVVGTEDVRQARTVEASAAKDVAQASGAARIAAETQLRKTSVQVQQAEAAARDRVSAAARRQRGAEARLAGLIVRTRNATRAATEATKAATRARARAASGLDSLAAKAGRATRALTQYVVGVKQAERVTTGWISKLFTLGNALRATAAIAAAAVVKNFIGDTLAEADAVGKLAEQVGVSTDEWQVWNEFALQAGATTEDLRIAMKAVGKNILTVAQTSKGAAADGFKKLDVEMKNADGTLRSIPAILEETGGKLGELANETERVALAQTLLGEASLKLLPGFKGGTAGVTEQLTKLKALAIVYDKDFIAKVEAANGEMALLGLQFKRFRAQLINFLLPVLQRVGEVFTPILKAFSESETAITTLRHVFQALAGVLAKLGIQKLTQMFKGLLTQLGGFRGLLRVLGGLVLRFVLPFLIFDDIVTFLEGGDSALGRLLDKLGEGTSEGVLENIKTAADLARAGLDLLWLALSGGDVSEMDGEIFALHGKLQKIADDFAFAWDLATERVMRGWRVLGGMIVGVWTDAVARVFRGWNRLGAMIVAKWHATVAAIDAAIIAAWDHSLNFLAAAWAFFLADLRSGWKSTTDFISSAFKVAGDFILGIIAKITTGIASAIAAAKAAGNIVGKALSGDFSGAFKGASQLISGSSPEVVTANASVGTASVPSVVNQSRTLVINNNQQLSSVVNTSASTPEAVTGVAVGVLNQSASNLQRTPAAEARQTF